MLVLGGVMDLKVSRGFSFAFGVAGAAGIVLGAWYLFTMLKNVFFGPLKEPHGGHEPVGDLNLREVAIMAIAVLNKADYEWQAHEPEYVKAGGTKEQLAALKTLDPKPFNAAEKAALQLTIEMTRDVQPKQTTIDAVRKLLPDDQVVELIGTIAGYNMVSRFLLATGVETESTQ